MQLLLMINKTVYVFGRFCCSEAMTSSDKMAAGGRDVTVPAGTSRSGSIAAEKTEMKCSGVGGEIVQQSTIRTYRSKSQFDSVASAASASTLQNSHVSAGNDDRQTGNGSRNPDACSGAQSAGRFRREREEFRPTSTALFRARAVSAVRDRSSYDAAFDGRTPVTVNAGSYSAGLRHVAAANGGGLRLPSTADRSGVDSPSAIADCRADTRSPSAEAAPAQELTRPFSAFPGRSSCDAAPEVRRASTEAINDHIQLQAAKGNDPSNYRTVSGPHRSVTSRSEFNEKTVVRSSTSSAVVDSCTASTAGGTPSQPPTASFDSRASASPQLRRSKTRPESGGQSSSAAQAGSVDHHHRHLVQPRETGPATKPHSVPCSPRLQARLAATQPWRPWSPPTSGGVLAFPFQTAVSGSGSGQSDQHASMDVSQLTSSLLLAKIIRDRQAEERSNELKLRGNYAGYRRKTFYFF